MVIFYSYVSLPEGNRRTPSAIEGEGHVLCMCLLAVAFGIFNGYNYGDSLHKLGESQL